MWWKKYDCHQNTLLNNTSPLAKNGPPLLCRIDPPDSRLRESIENAVE
jgi:hypothetical protein